MTFLEHLWPKDFTIEQRENKVKSSRIDIQADKQTKVLCISTSKRVLRMPLAGQNQLFLH